ncbi:hypothetical protein ACT3TP_13595 [Glutamicibacter sp. AOP38-B1-38]|uniref:hypothetical protein n=1 Tax=Glutamicibacter sp. AOP38-B1-38 TaxID=3457680 RepID=UPI004033EC2A
MTAQLNGPSAIGHRASAATHGLSIQDAVELLTVARQTAIKVVRNQETQMAVTKVIDDLRETVQGQTATTGDVIQRVGRLRALATAVGIPTLASVVGSATEAITELALSGAFG